MRRTRPANEQFLYVESTLADRDAYAASHNGHGPGSIRRAQCRKCGQVFWYAGIAVGAHVNRCSASFAEIEAWREQDRAAAEQRIADRAERAAARRAAREATTTTVTVYGA